MVQDRELIQYSVMVALKLRKVSLLYLDADVKLGQTGTF